MTVWTFLSMLSNVFNKKKLVIEEHINLQSYEQFSGSSLI